MKSGTDNTKENDCISSIVDEVRTGNHPYLWKKISESISDTQTQERTDKDLGLTFKLTTITPNTIHRFFADYLERQSYAPGELTFCIPSLFHQWLRDQAIGDDAEAQFELSSHYLKKKNYKMARYWRNRSAKHGHPEAITQLAFTYWPEFISKKTKASWDVMYEEQNIKMALQLFQSAADKGEPTALHILGLLHWSGILVKEDRYHAATLWAQAARQNHPMSQLRIWKAHRLGFAEHVISEQKALFYLHLAANKRVVNAEYELAALILDDLHPNKNITFQNGLALLRQACDDSQITFTFTAQDNQQEITTTFDRDVFYNLYPDEVDSPWEYINRLEVAD